MWTWALTGRGRAVGAELEGVVELSYSQPGPEGWHRQLAAILATVPALLGGGASPELGASRCCKLL